MFFSFLLRRHSLLESPFCGCLTKDSGKNSRQRWELRGKPLMVLLLTPCKKEQRTRTSRTSHDTNKAFNWSRLRWGEERCITRVYWLSWNFGQLYKRYWVHWLKIIISLSDIESFNLLLSCATKQRAGTKSICQRNCSKPMQAKQSSNCRILFRPLRRL